MTVASFGPPRAAITATALAIACSAHHEARSPSVPAPLPVNTPSIYVAENIPGASATNLLEESKRSIQESVYSSGGEILLTGPLAGAPAVSRPRDGFFAALGGSAGGERVPRTPPAEIPAGTKPGSRSELFDIEAHVELEVERVVAALPRLTVLVGEVGGSVVNESIDDKASSSGASLSLRIPSEHVEGFLGRLATLGRVRSRKVEATEISRKHQDAEVLLRNLEAALKRYEELLTKAQNVSEMTDIQGELSTTRTAIDRVKSDLEWMNDRVARSTVYVTLYARSPDEGLELPEPKLHPGLHLDTLFDVPPSGLASSFAGGGLSMYFARALSVDLDLFTDLQPKGSSSRIDFLIASAGGELYSDFLGGGHRRFFNPYLGFRGGYARANGLSQFALGGSLGVEIFRSEVFLLDLQTRTYAFIGPTDGAHIGVQPFLGASVSY